jgi:hypothetical protein
MLAPAFLIRIAIPMPSDTASMICSKKRVRKCYPKWSKNGQYLARIVGRKLLQNVHGVDSRRRARDAGPTADLVDALDNAEMDDVGAGSRVTAAARRKITAAAAAAQDNLINMPPLLRARPFKDGQVHRISKGAVAVHDGLQRLGNCTRDAGGNLGFLLSRRHSSFFNKIFCKVFSKQGIS